MLPKGHKPRRGLRPPFLLVRAVSDFNSLFHRLGFSGFGRMEAKYTTRTDHFSYNPVEGGSRDPRLTDVQATVAGALAWFLATCATQPLEMVRMHQQLGTAIGSEGALAGAASLLRSQSPSGMMRGVWIGWIKTFPEFLAKNLVLSSMRGAAQSEPTTAGMLPRILLSTISARLITYPFEVCKLRIMQFEGPKPYSGLYDTCRRIILEEGPFGLFKGLSMGLVANLAYSVTMALVSPWLHAFSLQLGFAQDIAPHLSRLIASFTAYPFETIKRRLASDCSWVPLSALPNPPCTNLTPLQILRNIASNDWTQLWAGFPLHATSIILKTLVVRSSHLLTDRVFMWNNGYTVSVFDSTPLPGIPQSISPNELLRRKRFDNRV